MEHFGSLLLDVWREGCRHIEMGEATSLIARRLAAYLPLEMALVRRFDLKRSSIETVGVGLCGNGPPPDHIRNDLMPEAMDHLLTWARQDEILHFDTRAGRLGPPGLVPDDVTGDVLVGPLANTEGPVGVLLLVARVDAVFDPAGVALLSQLLEPFSVAMENDSRLREMRVLREAAEADRNSLLAKLGRQDSSEHIVGADGGLRHVMDRLQQVARLDVPVLILGETGSGKEVVARAIHTRSRRATGPFLRVNCGAIPSELIDSELFGHERGSFTGAIATRKGWFERADGGTLFLDEIGELPAAAQVRLLRILQDGVFERVGAQRQMTVDVRIVAATHCNLRDMVADGRFREDLWYRIAVFPIELPSVRDRPEDIPALAAHFALRACRRFGFPPLTPSPAEINLLCAYAWPGNVRELAAVLDRAAILGDGHSLQIATALGVGPDLRSNDATGSSSARDLGEPGGPSARALGEPARPRAGGPPGGGPPGSPSTSADADGTDALTLDAAMVRHIESVLRRTNGQIEGAGGAARLLGINPHTLRARMRKLSINWQRFRLNE